MNRSNFKKFLLLHLIFCLLFSTISVAQTSENDLTERRNALRQVDKNIVHDYQKDKKFEYANNPEYWAKAVIREKTDPPEEFPFRLPKTTWYAIALTSFIAFCWLVFARGINIKKSRAMHNVATEPEDLDLSIQFLDKQINSAVAAADYRLAIRFFYLKTLRMLTDREIISVSATRTDIDLRQELTGTAYLPEFLSLQKIYQHVWYGAITLSAAQYNMVATGFDKFNSGI